MKKGFKLLIALVIAFFSITNAVRAEDLPKLPGYQADLSQTSVSGLSSGAFMTAQLHVAYSDKLIGAGIVAGGPFDCVDSRTDNPNNFLKEATTTCMTPAAKISGPKGEKLFERSQKLASENKIADVNNLKDDKVYLFSGANDETVKTIVVDAVEQFYKSAGVPEANIKYEKGVKAGQARGAGHAIIVADGPVPCDTTAPPYINDCDVTQSHEILKHIYGKLNEPTTSDQLSGKFIRFDQSEFVKAKGTSMDDVGVVYVPAACETESCKVHIAIHGCKQGQAVIGAQYYTTTGYNEIADTNKIIVLYPQVKPSGSVPLNPKGCWDFWGYSSQEPAKPVFYTRQSPQMQAIIGMVERLGQPRS